MKKQDKYRMFKKMKVDKEVKAGKKINDIMNEKVTRQELLGVQNSGNIRVDSALMGTAAVIKILVDKGIVDYSVFKEEEKKMTDILKFIRNSMFEAFKELGQNATEEDINSFVYDKCIVFGVDKKVLENIFGVKKSDSKIIKPKTNIIVSR